MKSQFFPVFVMIAVLWQIRADVSKHYDRRNDSQGKVICQKAAILSFPGLPYCKEMDCSVERHVRLSHSYIYITYIYIYN